MMVLWVVLGCSGADEPSSSTEPFDPIALTCDDGREGKLRAECCATDSLRPIPDIARTILDLSNPEPLSAGTCAAYAENRRGVVLPIVPEAYPLKVVLPAVEARDPGCETACPPAEDGLAGTAFGIAIETGSPEHGYLIGADTGRVLAISVPPPWYFVSGGCGEACAWPCLEGYQEFGVRSCITLAHGDFGFATREVNVPSVEAVIELISIDVPAWEYAPYGCCVFSTVSTR